MLAQFSEEHTQSLWHATIRTGAWAYKHCIFNFKLFEIWYCHLNYTTIANVSMAAFRG